MYSTVFQVSGLPHVTPLRYSILCLPFSVSGFKFHEDSEIMKTPSLLSHGYALWKLLEISPVTEYKLHLGKSTSHIGHLSALDELPFARFSLELLCFGIKAFHYNPPYHLCLSCETRNTWTGGVAK